MAFPNRILFSLLAVLYSLSGLLLAAERPNIIYIMTDDLGYGDLGSYGQAVVQTPNLDQMATEGMRFTDHYAGHTVCRPSRLVLWTGQHVGHTGLTGNRPRSLSGTESTVARLLKQAGYATGGVGKWALGNVNDPSEVDQPGHPNKNGFDYWCGYLNQGNAHNFYPAFLWENKKQLLLPGNVIGDYPNGRGRVAAQKVTYSHDVMTERALQFVRDHHKEPFLLHIHWTIPHANNEGGRVSGDGMEVPDYGAYEDRDWPNPEKGFAAMISRMDADVGRLFKLLKALDIDQNTVVFFTSDNGPHQEGGHNHEFFDSNGRLRGFKRSMHEGGIRVPLIARWPGTIEPGSTTELPSAFWDFVPTACELAGVELPPAHDAQTPAGIDGISYAPTLRGDNDQQQRHEYLYWASQEGETSIGLRMEQWKLVQYRGKSSRRNQKPVTTKPEWRLYDLTKDIGEDHDLADENPEIVAKMLDLLRRDQLLPD
ncbi:arylsulfatase [Rubripirellula sp.]|nr:arylsulfatase [Planctomycetaceae bacterium]MDA9856740.1 arylsulfatase [Rubripirellula sp.]MDF1842634.1 arylsulfatase [Rubripirellula sp.]